MLKNWTPLLITVLAALILAALSITPPSPRDINTSVDQFSSSRAMKDVRIIAAKPHPTGSQENRKVRTYLTERLEALGAQVDIESSLLNARDLARLNKWSGANKTKQEIFNVIGVLPGEDRAKPALLLMAHHDTVWGSPGAADDTVGLASILEITRALQKSARKRDLIILFTDGEELGLSGAAHFFKNNPLRDKIGAVINFEARGGGGVVSLFQTSRNNGNAVKLFAKSVKEPSASSLSTFVYNVLPNDTDLTPALEKNYTAYNIANIGRAEYYHSPKITPEALDEATLQHMGSQGLDLTRALLSAHDLPEKQPDATFFDVFGFFTVIYPAFLGWLFLAVAGGCYLMSLNHKAPKKEMLEGALRMLGFIFIGGLCLYGLNYISGNGPEANYYDRLAAITELEVLALALSLSAFFAFFGHKPLSENERFGIGLPLVILAIFGQAFAPTAAYFLTLPIMLCAIGVLAKRISTDNKVSLSLNVIIGTLIAAYMMMLGHFLMQGVGPDMLSIAILPASLIALAILPLYQGLPKSTTRYLALTGFMLAVVIALWIRFDPIAVTVPTY